MSGYNHYASCTCGWCLKLRGGQSGVLYASGGSAPAFRTIESFTTPNAACPVCGASVFFYQSPNGGRVFFDELGPPWTKHPCMDQRSALPRRIASATMKRVLPTWIREGWTPVIVQDSRMKGAWHVAPVELLARRLHIEVLSSEPVRVPLQCCALMRGFDAAGHGELSIVNLDKPGEDCRVLIYEGRRFAAATPFTASSARQRRRSP